MPEQLSASVDCFLDTLRFARNASEHTVANYSIDLAQFVEYVIARGASSMHDVDSRMVRSFLRDLVGYGYAKTSASRKLSTIRSFCSFLVERKELSVDPSASVRGPRLPGRLPRALSREDAKRLVESIPDDAHAARDAAVLELLYGCGLRIAEVVGLSWDAVDLPERWLRVLGKGDKERMVPMGRYAVRALERWKLEIGASTLAGGASQEVGGDEPVFPGKGTSPMTVRTVARIVDRAALKAGIPGVTPHVLRHSYATHMLEGGASIRVLQELLGHESIVTTQRYVTVTADRLRESYIRAHPRAKEGE